MNIIILVDNISHVILTQFFSKTIHKNLINIYTIELKIILKIART